MNYISLLSRFIYFLLCFFIVQITEAQRYNFRSWSLDEGLPQSQVFTMLHDSRGVFWIGTNGGGLTRFDGRKFETYTTDDGLVNNQIMRIIEDKEGNLWLFTFGGLSKFDGQTFTNFDDKDGLTVRGFSYGFQDGKGRIWYLPQFNGGNPKLGYFENDTFVNIAEKYTKELHQNTAYQQMFCTRSGKVLVDTKHGLYEYGNSLVRSPVQDLIGDSIRIMPTYERHDGQVFSIIFKEGKQEIKLIDFEQNKVHDLSDELQVLFDKYPNPYYIFEDSKRHIWLAGNYGLIKFDGKDMRHFKTESGLESYAIRAMDEDAEGNIWIGTNGDGMIKYTESPWTFYSDEHGIDDGFVWSILEHSDGTYWLGSTAGLIHFDGQKFEYHAKKVGKQQDILRRIVELDNGNLLVASYRNGIYEYDGQTLKNVSEQYGLEPRGINSILKDQDVFYFFQNQHLIKHQKDKTTSFTTDLPESEGFAFDLFKAKNGDIWIALNKGILKFNHQTKTFESYTEQTGLKNVAITQMSEDEFGRIWFGSYGQGLVYYDGKTFTPISKNDGLASNAIYSVTTDKTGNVWAGTQLGATKISFKKNGEIAKIENHGKYEGFFGVETNGKAILCDSKNNVWFGTVEGVQKYTPEQQNMDTLLPISYGNPIASGITGQQNMDTLLPDVRLKEMQLFMQRTNWRDDKLKAFCQTKSGFQIPEDLVLPYDQNHLTFRFESSSMRVPEKVRYQWKLAGAERDWTPITDKNEAVYANLRPGFYVFHLKAMNDKGIWSEELKYEFRITPPIWQRWWFLTFGFLGVLGLIVTAVRLRMRHRMKVMKEKNDELERMVQVRTKEVTRQNVEILEKNTELEQQQEEILAQNDHINRQNSELQRKNEDITASINYAQRIQRAILPFEERMQEVFPEHFIFFKPRDIVSGDFYWFQELDNQKFIISALDCTGHGVPGAFMSVIGDAILNQAVLDKQIHQADEILNYLNRGVRKSLQQDNSGNQDGMDVSLCVVDLKQKKMQFAGAMNPIFYIQHDEMHVIKGDKMPIGGIFHDVNSKFTRHEIDLNIPTTFYIFSDGYQDQFGGERQRKFMVKRFRELLFEIHTEPMPKQHQILENTLTDWMQRENQIDDILVIGGRI